jgi:poly(beta-D-mannuronate) lyase
MSPTRACAAVAALVFVTQIGSSPRAHGLCGLDDVTCGSDAVAERPRFPFGRDPFPKDPARRERLGRRLPDPPPLRRIPPVRDILGVSYYVDGSHSVADPALKAQNEAALRPLHAYLAQIAALADGWEESRPANPAYADRLLDSLQAWAQAGALLGTVNKQGAYERVWTLAGLSLAYLRVRHAARVDRAEVAEVEAWLGGVAQQVKSGFNDEGPMSRLNNHACWAATAVASAALAAHNRDLFDWAVSTGKTALKQVRADGFLPLELQRRALALHYHLFALAPLVMLSELARANGGSLRGADISDDADLELGWLVERVIAGLRDPSSFAKAAGAPQTITLPPRGADLAWAEIVYARTPNPQLGAWIAAARPLRDDRLGGSMTLAFGVSDLKK